MEALLSALKAAAEPTRLRLLALLSHGEATVSELCQLLNQSQPRVSRHLKLLSDAGLVDRVPEGTWVFYRLGDGPLAGALLPQLRALLDTDHPLLSADEQRLAVLRRQRSEAAAEYFRQVADEWHAIRSLHVSDAQVESAILAAIGASSHGDVLDVGTGTGRMLELLAPNARRAHGVDISHDMLRVARDTLARSGHAHVQARHADMYRLPAPAATYDLVVIHQVLHFADEPAAAIAEAARVLRPGGRLLVVDFAPHGREDLRTVHQHRRLGFAEEEVLGWCASVGLVGRVVDRLPGNPLTVLLWLAHKPATTSSVAQLSA